MENQRPSAEGRPYTITASCLTTLRYLCVSSATSALILFFEFYNSRYIT